MLATVGVFGALIDIQVKEDSKGEKREKEKDTIFWVTIAFSVANFLRPMYAFILRIALAKREGGTIKDGLSKNLFRMPSEGNLLAGKINSSSTDVEITVELESIEEAKKE